MSKSYKEMTLQELEFEKARLKYLLANKPDYHTYKQSKKALERIISLIAQKNTNKLMQCLTNEH